MELGTTQDAFALQDSYVSYGLQQCFKNPSLRHGSCATRSYRQDSKTVRVRMSES